MQRDAGAMNSTAKGMLRKIRNAIARGCEFGVSVLLTCLLMRGNVGSLSVSGVAQCK